MIRLSVILMSKTDPAWIQSRKERPQNIKRVSKFFKKKYYSYELEKPLNERMKSAQSFLQSEAQGNLDNVRVIIASANGREQMRPIHGGTLKEIVESETPYSVYLERYVSTDAHIRAWMEAGIDQDFSWFLSCARRDCMSIHLFGHGSHRGVNSDYIFTDVDAREGRMSIEMFANSVRKTMLQTRTDTGFFKISVRVCLSGSFTALGPPENTFTQP